MSLNVSVLERKLWGVSDNTPSREASELVEIREKLRFSQQEFAQRLGLSFTTYRNYEYRKPPHALLEKARTMMRGLETLTAAPSGAIPRLGAIGANTRGPISYARS